MEAPELTPGQKEFLETEAPKSDPDKEKKESEESKEGDESVKSEDKGEGDGKPEGTPYEGKFKSIKTVEQLEQSYSNSFAEAQRLQKESQAKDAEIARLKAEKEGDDEDEGNEEEKKVQEVKDPRVDAKQKAEDKKDWLSFLEVHSELADTVDGKEPTEEAKELLAKLDDAFVFIANTKRQKFPDEYFSMRQLLDEAWEKYVSPAATSKAKLEGAEAEAARQMAAGEGPGGGTLLKGKKSVVLTESEKKTAAAYGLSPEEYIKYKK